MENGRVQVGKEFKNELSTESGICLFVKDEAGNVIKAEVEVETHSHSDSCYTVTQTGTFKAVDEPNGQGGGTFYSKCDKCGANRVLLGQRTNAYMQEGINMSI